MTQINFENLEEWYTEKLEGITKEYKYAVSTLLGKLNGIWEKFFVSSKDFLEIATEDQNQISKNSAERLFEKIDEFHNQIKIPEKPFLYLDIESFIKEISEFQKQFAHIARRFVPKLTRDYKTCVRNSDGLLKSIGRSAVAIYKIQKKFEWVKSAESVYDRMSSVEEDLEKHNEFLEKREKVKQQFEKQDNKLLEIRSQLNKFHQDSTVVEFRAIASDLEGIERRAKDAIDILSKPYDKLTRDGKNVLPGSSGSIIFALSEDPLGFLRETKYDIDIIKKGLGDFLEKLNSANINYPKPKLRRVTKRLEWLIQSDELKEIQALSQKLSNKKNQLQTKVEFDTEEKLKEILAKEEKQLQYTNEELEKIDSDITRVKERITIQVKRINSEIYKAIKEKIDVKI
ncbi:MAG: hypothetical protein ACTSUV_05300 [Candidatus Ranarchaeia archaeon]